MATTTVSSILYKAATILQDSSNVRWTQGELVVWLNEGQVEAVLLKPNVNPKRASMQLAAGVRQTIPSDGVSLIDVVYNLGLNGETPGDTVRLVSRELMDNQIPNWRALAPNAKVKHFMFTDAEPKVFYVYPPQPATNRGYVEVIYAALPAEALVNGNIQIDDIYAPALLNYILYRAYAKDSEYAANLTLSQGYYQAFVAQLTGKVTAEQVVNPNQALSPANPSVGGTLK